MRSSVAAAVSIAIAAPRASEVSIVVEEAGSRTRRDVTSLGG
jgi:hypothetical protein